MTTTTTVVIVVAVVVVGEDGDGGDVDAVVTQRMLRERFRISF